jgi:hypothetical protein
LVATIDIVNLSSTKANYAITLSFLRSNLSVITQARGAPGYALGPGQMAVLNLYSVIGSTLNWTPEIQCRVAQVLRTASS